MFRTRWIRKLLDRSNSLGQRRLRTAKVRKPVRLLIEALEDRITPCDATSVVPGDVHVNFFGHDHSPAFVVPVAVNDNAGGVATSGTVTCSLVSGNSTTVLGSATVGSNGVANVNINLGALPDDLQPGSFQLEESYTGDNVNFFSSNAFGNLTIVALSTTVVPVNVSITATNTTNVTVTPSTTLPIGTDAGNYAVLYEGTGGDTLHIANASITGNIGVGGTGGVHINGPDTLNGTIDFSASGSGQIQENGHNTTGPSAINLNDAVVTTALNAVNALSSSLAGLGNDVAINGTQTINESDGLLVTVNGVSYRVFNVTSFHMGDNDVLTIKGDGSGNPVIFNFDGKGSVNLGGDVTLTNGLTPDQVIWNFGGSGGTVHLSGNASNSPSVAFEGVILAPNDTIQLDNANLIGRVFGGDSHDMQINGSTTITAPSTVVTIPTTTTSSFTVVIPVNSPSTTVTSGTVTLQLVTPSGTITLGSGTVGANGTATITVTDQSILQEIAALPTGSYQLIENFSGGSGLVGSSTTTTLTISPVPTTITVPNVNVTVNVTPTPFNINVTVNTPNGPVTSGTVTINLENGTQTIPLGTATLGPNGTFTLTVTGVPLQMLSTLPAGTYQILVNFTGAPGSPNAGSTVPGTLTITTPSSLLPDLGSTTPTGGSTGPGGGSTTPTIPGGLTPFQAALEIALDLGLLQNLGNPGALGEAELFASTILGHTLPTDAPALLGDVTSLAPAAGPLLGPALSFASFLAPDLGIENPM
jgi:choice-of-anchor A domain-containing protein